MEIIHAIILAIVEGLTEFLPVSSTGHMILTSVFIGLKTDDEFLKVFEVCIQFGAILSVVLVYFKRFFKSFDFYFKLLAAFIPTAILGLLLSDFIDSLLENVTVVALMLLVGGVILLFVDNWFKNNEVEGDIEVNSDSLDSPVVNRKIKEDVSYLNAFFIGLAQSVAMIPGVSRSAASIIGGLSQGITRKAAAEFSFFLAVPTMFAATAKKLYDFSKQPELMNSMMEHINLLIIGNVVAFIVALLAIRFFISVLTKYGFKFFGYYRIVLGAGILVMLMLGYDLKMV